MSNVRWQCVSWRGREVWEQGACPTRRVLPSRYQHALDDYYACGDTTFGPCSNTRRCIVVQAWWRGCVGRQAAKELRRLMLHTSHRSNYLNATSESLRDALALRHRELVRSFQQPDVHNPKPLKYSATWWFPLQPQQSTLTRSRSRISTIDSSRRDHNYVLCDVDVYERTSPNGFYALVFDVKPRKRSRRGRGTDGGSRVLGIAELEALLAPLFQENYGHTRGNFQQELRTKANRWEHGNGAGAQPDTSDAWLRNSDGGGVVEEWARHGGVLLHRRDLVEWVLRRMSVCRAKSGSGASLGLTLSNTGSVTGAFADLI
jgi:hypothetical protein